MISKIRPQSHHRYTSLPLLGPILDAFTAWSHKRGYTIWTIRHQLTASAWIDRFLRQHGARCLSDLTHNSFEAAWDYFRHHRQHYIGTVRQIERFLDETHRLTPLPPSVITPTKSELDRFENYLRSVRGLTIRTIQNYIEYLQRFLEYIGYDANTKILAELTSREIEKFICICAKRLNRYSLRNVVRYLQGFLKFQYNQGILRRPLHTKIDTPRIYRLEKLPPTLPWEKIKDFLSSIDRASPSGIRDYTMFFVMATYGLRACEIAALTLDDINWRAGILQVSQQKTNNQLILPMTDSACEVLIEYLKKGRLNLPYRELFLRVLAPHGPLKSSAVSSAFNFWVQRSGLDIPYHGPHCLRHSYAVHLLRQGTSSKTICDLLGHRCTKSVSTYLRLAVEDLRSVALPLPQEANVSPLKITVSKYRPNTKTKVIKLSTNPSATSGSFLAEEIQNYLQLKRSLGGDYRNEAGTFHLLDAFLLKHYPLSKDLTAEMFNQWCLTFSHLSPRSRRKYILDVRRFCLHRCRSHPQSFVPNLSDLPVNRQSLVPYIFSVSDIARLLSATKYLRPRGRSPIRAQTFRIAIILLYTTGLRHGELLRLKLGDYNSTEKTLFIRDTKFHKSRIIPLSDSVATELEAFMELRTKNHLPMDITSPLICNKYGGLEAKQYVRNGFADTWRALCTVLKILTRDRRPPRIHDLRHSFAITVLQRWYQAGENVQAKLPLLSTYLGHVSIPSTCYYLPFVEGIRSEASARFQQNFGGAVTTICQNP